MKTSEITSVKPLDLLLLEKDHDIIDLLEPALRRDFNLIIFNDSYDALAYLAVSNIDIIICYKSMPVMDGIEFLTLSRELHFNAIRILLTGYGDIETCIQTSKQGLIYSQISKSYLNQGIGTILANATEYYRLKCGNRELTEQLRDAHDPLSKVNESIEAEVKERIKKLERSNDKLRAALKTQNVLLHDVLDMMSTTIEYRTGFGAGHNKRIALQCKAIASYLSLDDANCRRIYLCALLHEIGIVGLKDVVLANVNINSGQVDAEFNKHPVVGAALVGRVHRFASLKDSILHQNENYDGTGFPDHLRGEKIPLGARIIRVVKDFDYLIAGKENKKRMTIHDAHAWLLSRVGTWYDNKIVDALFHVLIERIPYDEEMEYSVGIEGLKVGDTLVEDLVLANGNIMLTAGHEINDAMIEKLKTYERNYDTKITLFVA